MINQMPNRWNEWQKQIKSSGMSLGKSQDDMRALYNATKEDLVEAGLPLTGTSIFDSALELLDTGLVTKSPQPEAAEASGISGRTQAEVEKMGRDAAAKWETMTGEQKDMILEYAEQDAAFHDAFINGMIDNEPGGSSEDDGDYAGEETDDKASEDYEDYAGEETDDEASEDYEDYAGEETDDAAGDAGEETKDGAGEDTGEEPKEEHSEKYEPSLKRTASMDDDERKQAMKDLLGNYAPKETLVDDMGLPLGKEALLALAQLTPIWRTLTDQQKGLFLEEQGTFASGRQYVTSARKLRKPKNIRRKLQTSSGQVIFI